MAAVPSNMLPLGTVAPEFELPDVVSGEQLRLASLQSDKATVIMFICNHCPYVKHVNKGLVKLANDILNHDSTLLKVELNKQFIVRFTEILKSPASFDYPFEKLKTISRLKPEDDSFRIFTWQLVDEPKGVYYGTMAHYYFGLVQRKFVGKNGKTQYLVIPLYELETVPNNFESIQTDNRAWFGALYYQPKENEFLPHVDGYYYKLVARENAEFSKDKTKKLVGITYVPNNYAKRTLAIGDQLDIRTHKRIKASCRYYVLLGWNGWDNKSNYKVMELMTFDPQDSSRIFFGAPIIYYENIPKARGLFKYSEYAPFSLNFGYTRKGIFRTKKKMIIFDHLSAPNVARKNEQIWELGPDGTYDGLSYLKKYGVFRFNRDIKIDSEYNKAMTPRMLKKQMKEQEKRQQEVMKELGVDEDPLSKKEKK